MKLHGADRNICNHKQCLRYQTNNNYNDNNNEDTQKMQQSRSTVLPRHQTNER